MGFIYCEIAYRIPVSISYEVDHIGIVLSSMCIGYLAGRFVRSKVWLSILDFLKIRDTFNVYYWDDLMPNDCAMKVYVYFSEKIYEGMLHSYESYSNDPHLVLCSFLVKDMDKNVIEDFSNDCTRVVILDTSKAEAVYVEYGEKSSECRDIERLCNSHRKRNEKK